MRLTVLSWLALTARREHESGMAVQRAADSFISRRISLYICSANTVSSHLVSPRNSGGNAP